MTKTYKSIQSDTNEWNCTVITKLCNRSGGSIFKYKSIIIKTLNVTYNIIIYVKR